ncbi:hypothetical protein HDV05_000612 [Chytridiales sp. JEL 0842]|nr:hypothetical protein HDV05_000612 [Chytridiales sp. JEL 0842]
MSFVLPELPYEKTALAPHISPETIDYHYGKHHASYVTKLNSLISTNPTLSTYTTLESLLRADRSTLPAGVYNSAAQTWNHTFYWKSLAPASTLPTPNLPSEKLLALITKSFGSFEAFKKQFSDVAAGHFGSGWAWLVQDKASGLLKIVETHDAVSAYSDPSVTPVLTCDVWEHAYYIDYRNARPKYIESWWNLVNWKFAESNVSF